MYQKATYNISQNKLSIFNILNILSVPFWQLYCNISPRSRRSPRAYFAFLCIFLLYMVVTHFSDCADYLWILRRPDRTVS